jgi:hypothetical protein
VIKTGGEWISSLDLEDLVSRHPAVREVAVVGVADPQWGERPFALLVVREGQSIDARSLKEHLKPFVEQGHINKWAIPSQIAIVTEIPKTSVGKLDKKRIRLDITNGRPATAPSFPRSDCGGRASRCGPHARAAWPCQTEKWAILEHCQPTGRSRRGARRANHTLEGSSTCACWL